MNINRVTHDLHMTHMIHTSMARAKKKEERGTCLYSPWPVHAVVDEFCSAWSVSVTVLTYELICVANCKSSDVFHLV